MRYWIFTWPFWLPGFSGLAIGPVVLLKDRGDLAVLAHELVHVRQWYEHPLTFWFRYLWLLVRHGYRNNPYEVEAYAHQAEVAQALDEFWARWRRDA